MTKSISKISPKTVSLATIILLLVGCSAGSSGSSSTPAAVTPTAATIDPQLNFLDSLITYSNSTLTLASTDSTGNYNLSDNSSVVATVYSDSGCSTAVQGLNLTCSTMSGGLSSCVGNYSSVTSGTYYAKASTSQTFLNTSCTKFVVDALYPSTFLTYSTSSGSASVGQGNGYVVESPFSVGGVVVPNPTLYVEAVSGLTYQLSVSNPLNQVSGQSTNANAVGKSINTNIGSTITDVSVVGSSTSTFLYTVGTLTPGSSVSDSITISDSFGDGIVIPVTVQPSLSVTPNSLNSGSDTLTNVVSSNGTLNVTVSSGTGPYTYSVSQSAGIGSTFVNGVYTSGSTTSSVNEQIQVVDSVGSTATLFVKVNP